MTRHIVAIGQLPPPLNGFSLATKDMITLPSEANSVTVRTWSLLKHATPTRAPPSTPSLISTGRDAANS